MKKNVIIGVSIFILSLSLALEALARTVFPGRTRNRVNDYAGVIDDGTKEYIEKLAASIKQKTSDPVEVMVATFAPLDGWDFSDFVREYGEKWRLSKTGWDNGVVIVAIPDQRKINIGVGQNLKKILTDEVVAGITQKEMIPEFERENYAAGLMKGVEAIVNILNTADIPADKPSTVLARFSLIFVAILLFLLLSLKK